MKRYQEKYIYDNTVYTIAEIYEQYRYLQETYKCPVNINFYDWLKHRLETGEVKEVTNNVVDRDQ